ncbi:SagB/ThcOx family dehydrogenase [Streptomyces morookaense]|uniref:SagB/ThcOx family dehydrogenase n=1 Tax=Streptomyces morookaense TaxID=1970 RepID=A0A7Y7AZW9_STRMO|nr:SagB/ThcOx family dehydrogenase [Streptomyces morookaense]NVK76106.1 SagB/ThcOx family dehydrogenase [Streptomyces morookaense]GHF37404.1 streptolysin associated protein SagB [Streptomyces morookaense]
MDPGNAGTGLRNSAVYHSESRTLGPQPSAAGLRTHSDRFTGLTSGEFPRIAEEFLVAGRNRRWDRESQLSISHYFDDPMVLAVSCADHEPEDRIGAIPLPSPERPVDTPLHDAVARRRSVREYTGEPLALTGLATLLRHAGAVTGHGEARLAHGETARLSFRSVASAGGLYPVELWLAALRVRGLERALYRFLPAEDALARQDLPTGVEGLLAAADTGAATVALDRAAALLLFVAQPWRSMRKYGPRGMRHVFHETGAMAHAVHLTAAALGIGTTDFSSFYDDEAHEALGLDGVYRTLTHVVVAGDAAEDQ